VKALISKQQLIARAIMKLICHIPTKFGVKFPSSFESLPFD